MKSIARVSCLMVLVWLTIGPAAAAYAAPQGPWIKDAANPVMGLGPAGAWDDSMLLGHSVLKDGGQYKMWYAAIGGTERCYGIGYATSPDGLHWTRYPGNPVLTAGPSGSWDAPRVYRPIVVREGGGFTMWYAASDTNYTYYTIGRATSPDGITWTKDPANPVLTRGAAGSWESEGVLDPWVIARANGYEMYYTGVGKYWRQSIGRATSPDGRTWTKDSANPVLARGLPGDASDLESPAVLYDGALYRMWYTGWWTGQDAIGYATSPDGVHWTRHPFNLVLRRTPGRWDSQGVSDPVVLQEETVYRLWYVGSGPCAYRGIGLATAVPGGGIAGHVTREDATPLADARIEVLDAGLQLITSAVSGPDGAFTVEDLPAGDYYLEAQAPGYGRVYFPNSAGLAGAEPVTVTVPGLATGKDFTLRPGATVTGVVYLGAGTTPLAGALVELRPVGGGRPQQSTTATNGVYTVTELATGSYSAWAGYSSYPAAEFLSSLTITQPYTTSHVDFSVGAVPYLPLAAGMSWLYRWSNDRYHPATVEENLSVSKEQGARYTISAIHAEAKGDFTLERRSNGIFRTGYGTRGQCPYPLPMYMFLSYVTVAPGFLQQPLLPGMTWSDQGDSGCSPSHIFVSRVESLTETVTVASHTHHNVLHIHTDISGPHSYLAGSRDMWFALGVGLIMLRYAHQDGSTTAAELVAGPLTPRLFMPTITKNH